jgi:ABC-type amino acid transport substrate-binding protein
MKKILNMLLVTLTLSFFSLTSSAVDKIRFGVSYFYPPFVFSSKSGYIHGFDIDVAKAICQHLNAQCSFVAMPLAQEFTSLNNNQVDAIMGAISITPERQTNFDFTKPYYKSTMSYVTLEQANIDPNNLIGRKIGVVKDSTFQRYLFNKYGNKIQLMSFNTNEELATALSNKVVEIILIDTPAANYWVGYSTGLFEKVGVPQYLSFDLGYGIVVKKGNSSLLNALNSGLTAITSNGTLEKIKQSYFKPVFFPKI